MIGNRLLIIRQTSTANYKCLFFKTQRNRHLYKFFSLLQIWIIAFWSVACMITMHKMYVTLVRKQVTHAIHVSTTVISVY